MYCDIAGFGDSGPHLIQMINIFTVHYLINNVRSLRILTLFTFNQIREQRGMLVSKLVQEAINLIESDLDMINNYNSVFLPLISTKKILKSQNFDIDRTRADLRDIVEKHIFERVQDGSVDYSEQNSLELSGTQNSTMNNISI